MRVRHVAALAIAFVPLICGAVAPISTAAASVATHGPLVGLSNPLAGQTTRYSTNWSGYAATGATFTKVSASWVQPTGTCTSKATYSAFWVGLDGYTSKTVEQTGSEVDCQSGSPEYYAWYEMYPGPSRNFSNPVAPGDVFTASVTASGTAFTLKLTDTTQGWTHTEHKSSASAKKSSAEVITEAPCCTGKGGILPLTDFGTVSFTNADVDGSSIGSFGPIQINMGTAAKPKDMTSSLSGGNAFTDTWERT
jgi:hypothetical protein